MSSAVEMRKRERAGIGAARALWGRLRAPRSLKAERERLVTREEIALLRRAA
ncbi:MAG: hypothetical protein WAW85_05675 [Gordonia sp. (in: high G+C Gram-positive bacteria)]|uniref:hypothetical protein n=1 Tax=Gordonia sp. (in: high G+C Gram-positive bacteria) TaxID=84139 RepID=UPI003BB69449